MGRLRSYLPLVVMFVAGITFAALALSCRATLPFNFLPTAVPSPTATVNITVQILPSPIVATATTAPSATEETIPTPPVVPLPTRTPVAIIPNYSPTPAPTAIPPTATRLPLATNTPIATPQSFPDWRGEYFSNSALAGEPTLVRNDRDIGFDWSSGPPDGRLPIDNFSARWTRSQNFAAGTYRFTLRIDDGVRVFVDGTQIIDEWRDGGNRTLSADMTLSAGTHALRIEYYERSGLARAQLDINPVSPATAIPSATATHTPVPVVSITPLPFPIPTNTPQPSATTAPTRTPAPATITPLPLITETPLPTQPPPPTPTNAPTSTPLPFDTATPTPTPTDTPPPPSATQTATATTSAATVQPTAIATVITPAPLQTATPTPTATNTSVPHRPTATGSGAPVAQAKLSTGNQLLVTGSRWAKDEQVSIGVADNPNGNNARQVTRAKADGKGVLKVNWSLKEAPPNPLYVVASGKSGTVIVRAQLVNATPLPPTIQPTGDPNATFTPIP